MTTIKLTKVSDSEWKLVEPFRMRSLTYWKIVVDPEAETVMFTECQPADGFDYFTGMPCDITSIHTYLKTMPPPLVMCGTGLSRAERQAKLAGEL